MDNMQCVVKGHTNTRSFLILFKDHERVLREIGRLVLEDHEGASKKKKVQIWN